MRRELHVRFCESGGVRSPSATRLTFSTIRRNFPPAVAYRDDAGKWTIGEAVMGAVREGGFGINPAKTRFLPSGYRFGKTARLNRRRHSGRLREEILNNHAAHSMVCVHYRIFNFRGRPYSDQS
jgi:hypothetical protein